MQNVITGPGRYRQRDGGIATVLHRDGAYSTGGCPWGGLDSNGSPESWSDSGSFWGCDDLSESRSDWDLVERVNDPQPCDSPESPRHPTGRQLHELSDGTWKMVEVR